MNSLEVIVKILEGVKLETFSEDIIATVEIEEVFECISPISEIKGVKVDIDAVRYNKLVINIGTSKREIRISETDKDLYVEFSDIGLDHTAIKSICEAIGFVLGRSVNLRRGYGFIRYNLPSEDDRIRMLEVVKRYCKVGESDE